MKSHHHRERRWGQRKRHPSQMRCRVCGRHVHPDRLSEHRACAARLLPGPKEPKED